MVVLVLNVFAGFAASFGLQKVLRPTYAFTFAFLTHHSTIWSVVR